MLKLRDALKIDDRHEFGAAFDLELQEKKRLDKLAVKEKERKEKKKERKEAKRAKEREEVQRELKMVKEGAGSVKAVKEEAKRKRR